MSTITVSDRSGLLNALNNAGGGDTIILKDGHYGTIKVTADYSSTVTVRAEDPRDATIGYLEVSGGSNVKFDSIKFDSGINGGSGGRIVSIENSQNVAIVNSEVTGKVDSTYAGHYGIYAANSNGLTLSNNNVHDVDCGIVIFGSNGSVISNNLVDYLARDAMKFSGLTNATISDNISYGHYFTQPVNVHNDFIQFQGSSSNVRVDGNMLLVDTIPTVQGIFFNDGTYNKITVENNVIYTGMIQGVSINAGSQIVVRNNTLLDVPNEAHKATAILVPSGSIVENNISSSYPSASGIFGSNLIVQSKNPGGAYYVDDYFVRGSEGRGLSISDLTPVAGSLGATKGAAARIYELLGGGAPAPAPTPDPGPTPPAPSVPDSGASAGSEAAINSGGPASNGFGADAYYNGGDVYATSSGIAGTSTDKLYQSERWGDFKYSTGLKNGTYDVTLKFAEIYMNGAGQRLFDVKAENKLLLDNFDVYAAAGGKNAAVDRTFQVTVSDGKLDLDFISVKDNAKVNGIEIAPASGAAPAPAPAPTPAPSGGTDLAINAGGPATGGFSADAFFFGGDTYATGSGIAGTSADKLYQSERWGDFKYSAAVDNGTYGVTLNFAEIYVNGAGQRLFDVKAENKLVLNDYDVYKEAGGKYVAHDETFQVTVNDGKLDLDFISIVDNAKVNGIEIDYLG